MHLDLTKTCTILLALAVAHANADDLAGALKRVRENERARIELIERVTPSVVCVYDKGERGGGSGVVIDPDGYGITNFHVVAGMFPSGEGRGGLPDGWIYDIEVLGIDPTGDVAMFRVLSKDKDKFDYTRLGDSNAVKVGDEALVMGNPFVLSEDQMPSVSLGIITGVDRYQAGVKGNLAYTDCLQVDAAVNPGNSGGPLFNAAGEVIGINGRISVNTRGRFNVGFGYSIASNQIARFVPTLRAGLLARHGTLGITVADVDGVGVVVDEVRGGSAAERAGLRAGDVLRRFDGEAVTTRNRYASLLGTYPANWPVIVESEREGKPLRHFIRLDPIDPRMRHRFEPRRDQIVRQIKRTLDRYRQSVGVKAKPANDAPAAGKRNDVIWPAKWTVTRVDLNNASAAPEHYIASVGRFQREYDDGRRGALVEFDDQSAMRFPPGGGDAVALPVEDQMILAAQYLLWEMARPEFADEIPDDATDLGADALVRPLDQRLHGGPYGDHGPMLEVLEWPVTKHGVARFAFDVETGKIRRVTLHDKVTAFEAAMYFSDDQKVGAYTWPGTIEVYRPGAAYVDRLSQWSERTP